MKREEKNQISRQRILESGEGICGKRLRAQLDQCDLCRRGYFQGDFVPLFQG